MYNLSKDSKIFIAGHNGMVGSAIIRHLNRSGFTNIITAERSNVDLLNQDKVSDFFKREAIDAVILAAAKVGGIHANNTYPAEFIYENLMIQANVIHQAYCSGVKNLLFLGSSCIYPKFAKQPIIESALLKGELEPTNEPYAIAKIAGIKMCESYNRQYGVSFRSVMPTNLYGPGDNFHKENSHVIPALIRRFHEAKLTNAPEVMIWGSGKVCREFLHVDDMASACIHVLTMDRGIYSECTKKRESHINIGTGEDISIKELATILKDIIGYQGDIIFDTTKPEGTPKKLLDVCRLKKSGWIYKTKLIIGLQETYAWFCENINDARL